MYEKDGYAAESIIAIISIVIGLGLMICAIGENYYKENATQGIVVDKEVQQSRYASDPQYTLILEISFDSFGKTQKTKKRQIVDKETYLVANNGDLFDIQNWTIVKDLE